MSSRTRKSKASDQAEVRRDGGAIIIDIPMNLRRRSGRKEVVLPPNVTASNDSSAPTKPPTSLALALTRAFRWQDMIETGQVESNSKLARKLKLDPSYISRTIRLTSLAPDIVDTILNNQGPNGLSLKSLRNNLPLSWDEQRQIIIPQ